MKIILIGLVIFANIFIRVVDGQSACKRCVVPYKRVGCWKDSSNRALGELILTERDVTSHAWNELEIDWYDFENYLPAFVCRCAQVARAKGYEFIGVQHWGECWSAPIGKDDYTIWGQSTDCSNPTYKNCRHMDKVCVGREWSNFVYKLNKPCSLDFERIGCFKDTPIKKLPKLVLTDRDDTSPKYSHKDIDWVFYEYHLPDFSCRCAEKSAQDGYSIFGLQYWGECWSDADALNKYYTGGEATTCEDQCYETCDRRDRYCTGTENTNAVYHIVDSACSGITTTKLGCYGEDPDSRALDVLLIDDAPYSPKFTGRRFFFGESLEGWSEYIEKLTCRCAIQAKYQGYNIFGIHDGGQCWASLDETSYSDHGSSDTCFKDASFEVTACTSGAYCAGSYDSIYVHQLNS